MRGNPQGHTLNMITVDRLRELLTYEPDAGSFRWLVSRGNGIRVGDEAGKSRKGYRTIRVDGASYLTHRLAWLYVNGAWPSGELDHINGNKLDNRIANLRDVDHRSNAQNIRVSRSHNASGTLGVSVRRRGRSVRYAASIRVGGKLKHIGSFGSAEEAHSAYREQKRLLHHACTI